MWRGTSFRRLAPATLIALVLGLALLPSGAGAAWSPVRGLELPRYRLFDLGVVDLDRDGRLDVFTVNHKFQAALLHNGGKMRFTDRMQGIGLGHVPAFPGIDSLKRPEDMSEPGAYVWLSDRPGDPGRIHLRAVGRTVRATVVVLAPAQAVRRYGADVKARRPGDYIRRFTMTIRPGGSVLVNASALGELPISFDFDASRGLDARDIRVGARGARPQTKEFRVQLHDRHGFAFTDLNADGETDVFMVSGGAGGRVEKSKFKDMISDELILSAVGPGATGYTDLIEASGIEKGDCRGRDASWVDYDRDGRLDLFFSCEGRAPSLARGVGDGRFQPLAGPPVDGNVYRWVKLRAGDPRLIVGGARSIQVWRTRNGRWRLEQRIRSHDNTQLAAADMDGDGRIDLLTISNNRVRIFRNSGGKLRKVRGGRLELPDGEVAVAAVDVNNDGWLDLSTARNGLRLWDPEEGSFDGTGRFKRRKTGYAILNWPDLDNDGRRDLLAAYSNREFSKRSSIDVRRNRTRAGRWLQVDLRGDRGNRDAIGARVVVRPVNPGRDAPRRITQVVGQNEASRHSQGHYRTYFGLARAKRARLTVHWPAGGRTVKRGVAANQRIVLRK